MNKWQSTMLVYDDYEKRVANARSLKKYRDLTDENVKKDVISEVKKVLSFKDELVPEISKMEEVRKDVYDTFDVIQLRYETWENFYGCATLFMPHTDKKVPLVFVLCGHGEHGRLSDGYMKMAHQFAKNGVAALVPDNIGQGSRQDIERKNHNYCYEPFYLGLSLQGLIAMETVALIRYFKSKDEFDETKFASCGNSGGGTLNLFLCALSNELSAIAPSGYPSEFSYILSKERRHCACNILPGILSGPEMWEVASVFAPKPILLSQGLNDDLIPIDLAKRNARKVENVYIQFGKRENFNFECTKTKHSWEESDIKIISDFIFKSLGIIDYKEFEDGFDVKRDLWKVEIPDKSFTTSKMCENITGKKVPDNIRLCDIFRPKYKGEILDENIIEKDIGRGDVMHILAQFESMF